MSIHRLGGRRRLRRTPRNATLIIVLFLVLIGLRLWRSDPLTPRPPLESARGRVLRVVDGDTLLLEGPKKERVRLLGVNTPETVDPRRPIEPFGPEASAYTKSVAEGKWIRLEYDRERYDDHGRTLAYVYIDDLFLNEELIRLGFSRAQTQYPYRSDMKRRFVQAEEEARRKGVGIWTLPQTPRR